MSYDNPRISLDMTMIEIIMAMADGNPGAVNVLMEIVNNSKKIDPDNVLGEFGVICSLDTMDIYGSRIWMLYKDVCDKNLVHMLALMRAVQLGFLSEHRVHDAIDDRSDIDVEHWLKRVQERLPKFGQGVTA